MIAARTDCIAGLNHGRRRSCTFVVVQRRRLFRAASVLALSVTACHGNLRGVSTTAASPAVEPRGTAATEAPWLVASARETNATMTLWSVEQDGSRRVATGVYRLVVRPGSIDVAPDLLASDISNVFEFRDSWYFVTTEGDIFRAASFLGPLIDVGAAVGRSSFASTVRGDSVLLVDRAETLWSFDGKTTHRLEAPGPVSGVWKTNDGSPLVDVCGRWYAVDAGNHFSPARPGAEAKDEGTDKSVVTIAVEASSIRQALAAHEAHAAEALYSLHHLLVLANGGLLRERQAFPTGTKHSCNVLAAGREPLIACSPPQNHELDDDGDPSAVVYRLSFSGHAELWQEIPGGTLMAGPGPSFVVMGQYSDFWIHGGHRDELAQNIPSSGPDCASPDAWTDTTLFGLSGSHLLVGRTCNDKLSFDVLDLNVPNDQGAQAEVPLATFLPAGARVLDATLSADQSTLSVVMRGTDGAPAVARGELGAKLSVHPLPAHAKAAAFVDRQRGMAIGNHLAEVWITLDGALSWSRLAVPVEGDPASVPLTEPPTCNLLSCSSGVLVTWADPRALEETGYRAQRFMAPARVPTNRTFAGPRPRHESRLQRPAADEENAGCPKASR
jgi:hypothetical protein